ncbi:hypothetical protein SBBP1_260049 [Burkholderiales bacterium]|nr:hypothetical protein SBBP1_260049 [Burkholderiales bacterium]
MVVIAPRLSLGRIQAHLRQPAKKALTAAIGKDLMGLDATPLLQRICAEIPRTGFEATRFGARWTKYQDNPFLAVAGKERRCIVRPIADGRGS